MIVKRRIQVVNKLGLHTRAAAKLVKLTRDYDGAIRLAHADKTADAKSIMEVMMLAAAQGSELRLTIEGEDAHQLAEQLCGLFADCFGEGE